MIRERRKIPKEERLKMRQDSVDEVDTTDLENWVYRPDFHLVDHIQGFKDLNDQTTFEPRILDVHDYEKTR